MDAWRPVFSEPVLDGSRSYVFFRQFAAKTSKGYVVTLSCEKPMNRVVTETYYKVHLDGEQVMCDAEGNGGLFSRVPPLERLYTRLCKHHDVEKRAEILGQEHQAEEERKRRERLRSKF